MITDALLRSALEEMAGRAPDAERVRDGLAARARAHRQRRTLLVAGGAVTVAAAAGGTVGLGLLRGARSGGPGDDGPPAPNLPSPSPGPPAGDGNLLVPMHHRPTWLPEGVFEHQRGANILGNRLIQARIWRTQDPEAVTPHVQLFVMPDQELGSGEPVLVNGRQGLIGTEDSTALVAWPLDSGFSLAVVVGGMQRPAEIALRVARSVVPDDVSTLEVALDLGWLPDRVRGDHSVLLERRGSGADRQVQISNESYTPVLLLFLSREEQARLDGEPIGLRGRTGRVGSGWAQVELDDGRLLGLSLTGVDSLEPTVGELRRIVDEVRIGPEPYTGWIGQR